MLGLKRTYCAPGQRTRETAQADYGSDYECSHDVDATGRAKYNGLIYAPGPTCTATYSSEGGRQVTINASRQTKKGLTELAPYIELAQATRWPSRLGSSLSFTASLSFP